MGFIKQCRDVRGLASFATVVSPLDILGRVSRLSWFARNTWLERRFICAKAGDGLPWLNFASRLILLSHPNLSLS